MAVEKHYVPLVVLYRQYIVCVRQFLFSDFRDVIIKSLEKYSTALDDISNYLDDDKKRFLTIPYH